MVASSTSKTETKRNWRTSENAVIGMVIVETLLVTMALVPAQLWTRLLPHSTDGRTEWAFPFQQLRRLLLL